MSRKVLVLDDDEQFRRLLREALEACGLDVVEAKKARGATGVLAKNRPDLAIVDGLLPDESGIDWITRLRAKGDSLPIVFVSSFWRDLDSYKKLTQELGVALVMHKPLDVARLANRIEVLLLGRPPRSSKPDVTAASPPPELAASYRAQLPGRLDTLAAALERVRSSPDDRDTRTALRKIAHELRGTAGSFGYHDVSDVAGRIEDALVSGRTPDRETVAQLDLVRSGAHPVQPAPTPVDVPAEGLDAPGEVPSTPVVRRPRVLLVDDDTMFLEHAVDTADAHLLDLTVAGSVEVALSRVASERSLDAALVGLPLGEPDRSGELVEALRSRGLPVGVVALDEGLSARLAACRAGASLFLPHPVSAGALARAVNRLSGPTSLDEPVHVLVIAEDPVTLDRASKIGRPEPPSARARGAARVSTCGAAGALQQLERARPDAVMIDARVGRVAGSELCRIVRAAPRYRDIPIVLLAKTGRAAERADALAGGADDCVSKLEPPAAWLEHVRVAVRAARRRAGAVADAVTGLPGREDVLAELDARIAEARRYHRAFAIALVDVDDLTAINRDYGQTAGDRVLGAMADLVRSRFRAEDVRGRIGPDELVVGLVGADSTILDSLLTTRDSFSTLQLHAPGGETFTATFSVGCASYPVDGNTVAQLLSVAEARLCADRERLGSVTVDASER
jgi:diguanylate cyclase (GGDEF)-like protein